ncbi:tetratricopeptide repeat protein [Bacillus sp. MHSD_36]|uniref:tetratricopeptide repeat protein n=1 Tax=unclassified Bacillus (in: firmicutes) TaxID=185979 RepID=UPI0027415361|nr:MULTISPECIES: tetratricopeptide repeat protein [unclassified Bacillus (in: firmicutes)]MDP7991393.1 tetratricopeptide repeat protein [Bacillus sp. MHSD_36]MDR4980267.1 tetratricopeptide repeat protein [Bacillus sp. MHSD_37]
MQKYKEQKELYKDVLSYMSEKTNGTYLISGEESEKNLIMKRLFEELHKDFFIYKASCKDLNTNSFSFIKSLINPYIEDLENKNPTLLTTYGTPICSLMPWLAKKQTFKDTWLGLDIPRLENPTSLTLKYVYRLINGIINFMLAIANEYEPNKKVIFILNDVDKCDYSSSRFIQKLIMRSKYSDYFVIGSFSDVKNKVVEKIMNNQDDNILVGEAVLGQVSNFYKIGILSNEGIEQPSEVLTPRNEKQLLDLYNGLSELEKRELLSSYISSCGLENDLLKTYVYESATYEDREILHKKNINDLLNINEDLTSKFSKIAYHLDKIKDNSDFEILYDAANYSQGRGHYEEAIFYVNALTNRYWDNLDDEQRAKLLRVRGVSYLLIGETQRATESLESCLTHSNDPYFKARVFYILGSLKIKKKVTEEDGLKYLNKGFNLLEGMNDTQAVMARIWLNNSKALYYYKNSLYNEAVLIEKENIKVFKEILTETNHKLTQAILHYNTAYALQDMKLHEQALSYIEKAITLVPSHIDLYNNKGNILQSLGKFEEAIKQYEIVKNEGFPMDEAYINCGNAYLSLGDYKSAFKDYNYAINLDIENINAWNARGYLYYVAHKFENALRDLSRALSINHTYIPALINRANTYCELQKYEKAFEDYNFVITLSPNSVEAYLNRGALYQELKIYDKAKKDFKKAIELNPLQAATYVNLAIISLIEGHVEEAKLSILKAVDLEPNNATIRINKTYLHLEINEIEEAYKEISSALELLPDNKELLDLYENVKKSYHSTVN